MISDKIEEAKRRGAESIGRGCAGMSEVASDLDTKHAIPVVEGVGAAVGLAGALAPIVQLWARATKGHLPP